MLRDLSYTLSFSGCKRCKKTTMISQIQLTGQTVSIILANQLDLFVRMSLICIATGG